MKIKDILNSIKRFWNKLDSMYSVGSVYVTSTNTNPSAKLGGTWELIDKEFSCSGPVSGGLNINTTNVSKHSCYWSKTGHTIVFEIVFTNKVNITDTTLDIGQIDLQELGVTRFDNTCRNVGFSDGGNAAVFIIATQTGAISSVDIIPESSIASGNTIYLTITYNVSQAYMLDFTCDKFYWKRIS